MSSPVPLHPRQGRHRSSPFHSRWLNDVGTCSTRSSEPVSIGAANSWVKAGAAPRAFYLGRYIRNYRQRPETYGRKARQFFSIDTPVNITQVQLASRTGTGTVTAQFYNASGSAVGPSDTDSTAGGWGVWLTFDISATLQPGSYYIQFSCSGTQGGGHKLAGWRSDARGLNWMVQVPASSYADYHDGSSWKEGWPGWSSPNSYSNTATLPWYAAISTGSP